MALRLPASRIRAGVAPQRDTEPVETLTARNSRASVTDGHTRPRNRTGDTGPGRQTPRLRGRFVRTPETALRDEQAAELHSAGASYREVADVLGYTSPASASRAATRARMEACHALTALARAEELALLDKLREATWRVLEADHVRTYRGRPVLTDPDDPTSTVPDYRPTFRATDLLLRIMDRECKILGLYPSHPGPRIGARR